MATCPHGLDAATCLICETLGKGTTTISAQPPAPTKVRRRDRGAVPAGRAEVLSDRPVPRRHLGLVGWLVVLVVAALLGWWVLGLIWAVLRVAEMVVLGLACGYLGYKVGVVSGRHQVRG